MKSYKVYRKNGQVLKVQADREGITPEGFLVFENITPLAGINPVDPQDRKPIMVFKEWEYYEVIPSKEEELLRETMKQSHEAFTKLAQESKNENHSSNL